MHPGVIECSPPKVNGNNLLSNIFLLISPIWLIALFIFLLILKGFKVLMPIFLNGSHLVLHHIIQPDEKP